MKFPHGARPGLRVILVEDNPFDAELMEMSLRESLDCNIVVVYSREMFLAELEHELPVVIISDSNLPTFDGFTALALARELCPGVPFVVCSGRVTESFKADVLARGADACVSKDDPEQLVKAVLDLCAGPDQGGAL